MWLQHFSRFINILGWQWHKATFPSFSCLTNVDLWLSGAFSFTLVFWCSWGEMKSGHKHTFFCQCPVYNYKGICLFECNSVRKVPLCSFHTPLLWWFLRKWNAGDTDLKSRVDPEKSTTWAWESMISTHCNIVYSCCLLVFWLTHCGKGMDRERLSNESYRTGL